MKRVMNSTLVLCASLISFVGATDESPPFMSEKIESMLSKQEHPLTAQQKQISFIAAVAATGNMPELNVALQQGLDSGLTVSDCREVLIQLYAYAGFPRSLNALGELMKVIELRKANGIQDAEGQQPGPRPAPAEMLVSGTQNQTALAGQPVKGPLFEFAPAADEYLKTHLFGDIFSRDNLNWKSRELATVGTLSAISGVEPQLKAHLGMSMNVGLTRSQLAELGPFFEEKGEHVFAQRLQAALASLNVK